MYQAPVATEVLTSYQMIEQRTINTGSRTEPVRAGFLCVVILVT